MVFRHIVLSAFFVGIIAGLTFTVVQQLCISPLIFDAEKVEQAKPRSEHVQHTDQALDHHHNDAQWQPKNQQQRFLYTVFSNVVASIAFALMLLSVMYQCQSRGLSQLSTIQGIGWGFASFIVFFVAPAIGMPPEIPGMESAPINNRQLWWLFTVLAAAVGLALFVFSALTSIKTKAIALLVICLPYLVGAPTINSIIFITDNPATSNALEKIQLDFIIASAGASLLFWLVTSILGAIVLKDKGLNNATVDA